MGALDAVLGRRLAGLSLPLALQWPGGQRVGPEQAAVTLRLQGLGPLAHLAGGEIGRVAEDYVEGRIDIDGSLRDLMAIAAELVRTDPRESAAPASPLAWWRAQPEARRAKAEGWPTPAQEAQALGLLPEPST